MWYQKTLGGVKRYKITTHFILSCYQLKTESYILYIYIYTYIYIYIYIYTHTHRHTHTECKPHCYHKAKTIIDSQEIKGKESKNTTS